MSISSFFDVLASHEPVAGSVEASTASDPDDSVVLSQLAGHMMASSLDSGKTLREFRERMFPTDSDPASLEVAHALRHDLIQWVIDAEGILNRTRWLKTMGHPLPARFEELNDMIGMTQAMLQITPESFLESVGQARRGEGIPLAEVRRELRLKRNALREC